MPCDFVLDNVFEPKYTIVKPELQVKRNEQDTTDHGSNRTGIDAARTHSQLKNN
jgi:hypothetical protein